jgi:hypothetical protein
MAAKKKAKKIEVISDLKNTDQNEETKDKPNTQSARIEEEAAKHQASKSL